MIRICNLGHNILELYNVLNPCTEMAIRFSTEMKLKVRIITFQFSFARKLKRRNLTLTYYFFF